MPVKVTLTVVQGKLEGQEFVFDERATCIMGRDGDCRPQLPKDKDHKTISRHHCLLDINPPDVRVRDFGSLNGTWVNGAKIGQRTKGMSAEEAAGGSSPEHDLKDGDEIKLGATVFRVRVFIPALCTDCSAEIPEEHKPQFEKSPGVYQCAACREKVEKAEQAKRQEVPKAKGKVCAVCGKDVSQEMGEHRRGEFICAACKTDPLALLKKLLDLARTGEKSLLAIQGYKILKELGKGGMGAVYLARHERTGEQVALKVMLPKIAADARATEMFLRETQNTKALNHRNVVQLRESGCSQGTFFFTLEYCDGGSVDKLMKEGGGTLSIAEAGPIVLQALEGLDYAHHAEIPYVKLANGKIGKGRGLVHRDLKPQNLFLTGTGGPHPSMTENFYRKSTENPFLAGAGGVRLAKIGDYGMAKAFDTAGLSGHTCAGDVMGTPPFMPRQQVLDFKFAKPEVDVWAMAASLYFMLTGRYPREFSRGQDPWAVVLRSEPVPIRQRKSSIPKKLADLIDRALVDKRDLHFKSAAEFKQALEKVL